MEYVLNQYKVYFKLYSGAKHFEKYWSKESNVTFRIKCLKYVYANIEIIV